MKKITTIAIRYDDTDAENFETVHDYLGKIEGIKITDSAVLRYALHLAAKAIQKESKAASE